MSGTTSWSHYKQHVFTDKAAFFDFTVREINTIYLIDCLCLSGGGIDAREKNGQFYPERPLYRVMLKALSTRGSVAQHTWRGTAVIYGKWTVPGWRYLRGALAVMRREAGF